MKADARARLTAGLEMVRGGKRMDPGRSGLLPALTAAMILAALALAGRPSIAATDPRLGARLDPETAAAVEAVIDAARDKGLPVEPLVDRALEGGSRQAPGPRIVASVRSLAADLETAREAMGAGSSPAELVAGAAAVAAGVRPDTLARLRAARPRESVVVPLVVLTDLVIRRVPIETAGAAVLAATRAHVRDRELMRLRQRIDLDIGAGAPPAKAAIVRTRNLIGTFEGPASRLPPADRPGSGP